MTTNEKTELVQAYSISMPPSLIAELKAVARENDRTLSAQARIALREWLATNEERAA